MKKKMHPQTPAHSSRKSFFAVPHLQSAESSLSSEVQTELEMVFDSSVVKKYKEQIHRQIFFCHEQITPSPSHRVASHRPSMFRLNSESDNKDRDQRHFIITEIVESEEVYNRYLHIVMKYFEQPLRSKPGLIKKDELDIIFCNIEELIAVSTQLISDLHEAISDNGERAGDVMECHSVASLFHASRFKAFVKYIANADEMQSTLTKKLKRSVPFAKFIAHVAANADYMDGLHLSDLLIMPVQRLPRYGLFIGDLLNYLPEHLKKRSGLRLAMDQIKTVGRQAEQYMSEALLQKLQLRFGTSTKIMKPGRRLVSEGVLTQKDFSMFRSKRFMVLLFNDCVMFYLDGESTIDETILMVDIIEVRPAKSNSKCFEMKLQPFAEHWGSQKRVLMWEADNKYEKISWVNMLKDLIKTSNTKHKESNELGMHRSVVFVCVCVFVCPSLSHSHNSLLRNNIEQVRHLQRVQVFVVTSMMRTQDDVLYAKLFFVETVRKEV